MFQLERVKGKTIREIATSYDCHPNTVMNYINRARSGGLIVDYARSMITEKLLPLTLAVYEQQLEAGNLEAAQDLIHGLGILQRTSSIKHQAADPEDTLDAYREKFFKARQEAAVEATVVASSPSPSPTVERLPAAFLPAAIDPRKPPTFDPSTITHEPIDQPSGRQPHLHDQTDEGDE